MLALSFFDASSSAGTIEAVTRLPPEPGPGGSLETKLARQRVGDHGARSSADILHREARDETAALDGKLCLGVRLPQIEPIARGDPDAAAKTARGRSAPCFPHIEPQRPVVETGARGVRVPALAQHDRIDAETQRRLVDRLFECERHRRAAGPPERRAGPPIDET